VRDSIVLKVDACESLGICDSIAHYWPDSVIADEHPANIQMDQAHSRLDQLCKAVRKFHNFTVVSENVFGEAQVL